ncbi:MAG: alanine racemase [Chloroflexi bacterium]|nr:alanine racemase [Chloroflexota bacterium]
MKTLLRPNWIEVDQQALSNNVQQVRQLIGPHRPLMAVVKANAYGHGAVDTATVLLAAGAQCLAVATPVEGIELRQAGIQAPILVLGYTPTWLAQEAVRYQLTTTVYDVEIVHALHQAAVATGQAAARVHVKVDTGLNRLGLTPSETPGYLDTLQRFDQVQVEGIFTHFATSDGADKSFAHEQFGRFTTLLATLTARGLRPPVAHAANSAALLTMPETHLDLVRTGIALYGLHPDADDTRLPDNFRPALRWKTQVAQVRQIAAGESVSYGREFIAPQPMTIAIIPVGYADGFPRRPFHWGSVLLHGRPAPILGRVCMDQTIVDVTAIVAEDRAVQQGDEVILIGRQGAAELSADEVATRLGTNNYDVVSRILARVPRLMVETF